MKIKLTLPIKKALTLLSKDLGDMYLNSSDVFNSETCPIACVYGVDAVPFWTEHGGLSLKDKVKLKEKGWDKKSYEGFIKWHDEEVIKNGISSFPNRDYVLKILGGSNARTKRRKSK